MRNNEEESELLIPENHASHQSLNSRQSAKGGPLSYLQVNHAIDIIK